MFGDGEEFVELLVMADEVYELVADEEYAEEEGEEEGAAGSRIWCPGRLIGAKHHNSLSRDCYFTGLSDCVTPQMHYAAASQTLAQI